MIPGIEFGWAENEQTEQCARRSGADLMLCGRRVGFVPVDGQPDHTPRMLHGRCRDLLFGGPKTSTLKAAEVEYGLCPACHGQAPVFDGRIQGHGEVRVGSDGVPYASEVACVGVNMRPST